MIRMIQPEFWADQAFFRDKLLSQLAMNSVSSQNIEDGQLFCLYTRFIQKYQLLKIMKCKIQEK